jgi:hypothetical protein
VKILGSERWKQYFQRFEIKERTATRREFFRGYFQKIFINPASRSNCPRSSLRHTSVFNQKSTL